MIKVAITGNIASGKSCVEKFLTDKGYVVIDTDKISHSLLDKLNEEIKTLFKNYDISTNNVIDRKKLGEIVFNDNKKLKELENVLHPKIKKEIAKYFNTYSSEKIIFVSVPQLFEVHWENLFDKIILVTSDKNIRLNRLMMRNNLSEENALKRINSQISDNKKLEKCDFIIENNSTLNEVEITLEKILAAII